MSALSQEALEELLDASHAREDALVARVAELVAGLKEAADFQSSVNEALGPLGVWYMDPPDGGGVDLPEFLRRAVADLLRLRARVATLEADPRLTLSRDALLLAQRRVEMLAKDLTTGPLQRNVLLILASDFAQAATHAQPEYMWRAAEKEYL